MSIRLKVQDSDSRYISTHPLINSLGDSYSLLMDRGFMVGQILNASGATVAQCLGNGNSVVLLQAMRNYMTSNLSFVFFDPSNRFDETAVSFAAPSTNTLTRSAIPTFGSITLRYNSISATSAISFNATAAEVQASLRTISGLQDVTVSGTMATAYTITNSGIITPLTYSTTANTLQRNGTSLVEFDTVPDEGVFQLSYGGNPTADIDFDATAADVQTALRLVAGLSAVTVSGDFTVGFTITFVGVVSPTAITMPVNTLETATVPVTPTITIPIAYAAVTLVVA